MQITDLFIKRPVLATVVSLMILVLGLRSVGLLTVRQFPYTVTGVVTITTTYVGADPAIIAGFITTPLEASIAQANGIDYMTSTSTQSTSTIVVYLRLNYDPNAAVSDINTKVNAVLNQLPKNAQVPVITVDTGDAIDSMYLSFYSDVIKPNAVTDYLIRVIQPKLQAINGVQVAEIIGNKQFAMRAWLDPVKLAALKVTPADIGNTLANNDFISAAGRSDGSMFVNSFAVNTNVTTVKDFRDLIIKAQNGAVVHLGDVATVDLGAVNYDTAVSFNGEKAVYIGIKITPEANLLEVAQAVKKIFPSLVENMPEGLHSKIVYDSSEYVHSAVHEVIKSLVEALVIVTVVIFLFLGSIRSVVIPVVAIPLSLIGAFFIMLLMHYSINLLSLLALVLAIGLVVDDAIIVVENVYRHIEQGMKPTAAAIQGARELANPIIAISVVLIAVYVPIGFMGGLSGALFTEFAFTLAGAVAVSAIVALTLSPMMCAKFLKAPNGDGKGRFVEFIDTQFEKLEHTYYRLLHSSLDYLSVTAVFSAIVLVSIYFLYATSNTELAPQEDQGIIIGQLTAAPNAGLPQTQLYSNLAYKAEESFPETNRQFKLDGISGLNTSIVGMGLKPWDERSRTAMQLQPLLQQKFDKIAGAKVVAFQRASLPGGGRGLPIQMVLQSTDNFNQMNEISQELISKAYQSGMFMYVDSDLKIDKAETIIQLNRDKISQFGLTMQDVGNVLTNALSQNYINYFSFSGRSYQVIPQMNRDARYNSSQLLNYYIRNAQGAMIPLSTVASLKTTVIPESLNHFQQLNSATISAIALPGVSMGQALDKLRELANPLPNTYTIDYAGQSRQFAQEGTALIVTFFFALIIIYLSLAALFESFYDPLTVLVSVPMSICGAMLFISIGIGGATLNIYTEVGLVTLIGLISKHGILIVQFANDLQREGKSKREAIEQAAHIRLRPILMTTASMVLGVIPLVFATGAGAVSRYDIGLVISTGISIGTLFTLFVVPAMYMFLAQEHAADELDKEDPLLV